MIGPITLREFVRRRHIQNEGVLAPNFIDRNWPSTPYNTVTDEASIYCAVSTTERSTVMILSKGGGSHFTRNTLSVDEEQPWLIGQFLRANQSLSDHISTLWSRKEIHRDGNRDLVNQIAEHVVYILTDRERREWRCSEPIVADENNVIRFETEDFVMWSHPPRDAPLTRVLKDMKVPKGENFNQVKGDMGKFFNELISIRRNNKIPDAKRSIREADQLKKIGVKFSKLYKFYETMQTDNHVPNSYKWPTLQLGVRNGEGNLQRYGETFAGVYEKYDNEVHHVFYALNVKARALPSKEEVFQALLPEGLNLTLHDIEMADQNQS